MTTVRFSIPEDVKRAFNATFRGRDKNALITALMKQAVEEEQAKAQRLRAAADLMARRERRPTVTQSEVDEARDELREHQ